jgi:hypothetical protein
MMIAELKGNFSTYTYGFALFSPDGRKIVFSRGGNSRNYGMLPQGPYWQI